MPGDKSIAHRALIFGALADGRQVVHRLPESSDVASTVRCLRALGTVIERVGPETVHVSGIQPGRQHELDAGNSGTTARLLAGALAGIPGSWTIDGDDSLRRRPMQRIVRPLEAMGATVEASSAGTLPMRVEGGRLHAIVHHPEVASAQVKTAVLLAGLRAEGRTTVVEPAPSRDHSERMLRAMGVAVECDGLAVSVVGGASLHGVEVVVPGDLSSAAFFLAAATVVSGSDLVVERVGLNPTRTGFVDVLRRMGGQVCIEASASHAGEPVADLRVTSADLGSTTVSGAEVPRLIDELPLLAVVASQASGETVIRDAAELRHKESDRIAATVDLLRRLGAEAEELPDGLVVAGPCRLTGGTVDSYGDHRIAMAAAVAGLVASGPVTITNADAVAVSYPEFFADLESVTVR